MADFDTIGDQIEDEVQARGSKTRAIINRALISSLGQLARYRVLFMEGTLGISSSVQTSDGLEEAFGATPANFPADIQQIDSLWWEEAGATDPVRWPIKMTTSIEDVTLRYRNLSATGTAQIAAWHHNRLVFAPKWGGIYALKGFYYKDARRNAADGVLITTTSTTHTNGWFTDGALCLRALATSITLASPYLRNEAAAGPQIALYTAEVRRLTQEYRQKTGYSAQAPRYGGMLEGSVDRLAIEGLSTVP